MSKPSMQATQTVAVHRHQGLQQQQTQDQLICEHPVAIVFNGLSHAVMMATPTDLEDFGLGFALSEGIIDNPGECHDISVHEAQHGIEVRMQISARRFDALKTMRRTLAGRTGCGLCGADSLQTLHQSHPVSSSTHASAPANPIETAAVLRAFDQLHSQQLLQADTGACHAAAWASADGHILVTREDVGRHNALDKLIGQLARTGQLGQPGFVLMTSRASYELVSKCARVGIDTLATISAPTSLAVTLAIDTGVHLFGFCRGDTAVQYTPSPRQPTTQALRAAAC
jgi:FdhD protein